MSLDEDWDTLTVTTITDPSGQIKKELTEKDLEKLQENIPFFKAFKNFGEAGSSNIALGYEGLEIPLSVWRMLLDSLIDPREIVLDRNETFKAWMLFDYIYCDNHHRAVEILGVQIVELPHQHYAHDFTAEGLLQLRESIARATRNLRANDSVCQSMVSMCEPFEHLFRVPGEDDEMREYVAFKEEIRLSPDLAALHSKSLRRIDTDLGKESTHAVLVPEHFNDYLEKFSQGLHIPQELGDDCVISGGSIVSAYFNLPNTSPDADLDYWISNKDKLFKMVQTYKSFCPNALFIVNYSVITVVVPGRTRYIQLIYKEQKPWQVIASFDLDYVQAYYDGNSIRAFPECIRAWETKETNPSRDEIHTERVQKARDKGFKVNVKKELPTKKSRWNFYYPKPDENREHVKHILACMYPRSQGVFETLDQIKENLVEFTNPSEDYQTVEVGFSQVLEDFKLSEDDYEVCHVTSNHNFTMRRLYLKNQVVFKVRGLLAPYGISEYDHHNNSRYDPRRLYCLSEPSSFVTALQRLDEELITAVQRKSNELFHHRLTRDDLEYTRMCRDDNGGPNFFIRFQVKVSGRDKTEIVNGLTGEEMNARDLTKDPFAVDIEGRVSHCYATGNNRCGPVASLKRITVWPSSACTMSSIMFGVLRAYRE